MIAFIFEKTIQPFLKTPLFLSPFQILFLIPILTFKVPLAITFLLVISLKLYHLPIEAVLQYQLLLLQYIFFPSTTSYLTPSNYFTKRQKIHIYSLSLQFFLWSKPHYRKGSYSEVSLTQSPLALRKTTACIRATTSHYEPLLN